MKLFFRLLSILSLFILSVTALAHHSVPAEFGDSSRPTDYMEAEIINVRWLNPHVFIDLEISSSDKIEAGEKWRLTTHPIHILNKYGIFKEDFAVGDQVKIHGWLHIRNQPLVHPRAMSVNDGPMRSFLTFADFRDIVSGQLKEKGIVPAPHLPETNPGRAGEETVNGLREMGLLGEDGKPAFPEGYLEQFGQ